MNKIGLLVASAVFFSSSIYGTPNIKYEKSEKLSSYGFPMTEIVMNDLPKNQKITLMRKRIVQKDSEIFEIVGEMKSKDGSLIVNEGTEGFLPGELVTYACKCNNKILCEAAHVPVPINIERKDGSQLLKAVITSIEPTSYFLSIEARPDEEFLFLSKSSEEVLDTLHVGPTYTFYLPAVVGKSGGYSHLQLYFADGEIYSIDFPYGSALIPYLKGEKKFEQQVAKRLE